MKYFVLLGYGITRYSPNGSNYGYIPIGIIPAENFEEAAEIIKDLIPGLIVENYQYSEDSDGHSYWISEAQLLKSADDKNLIMEIGSNL